MEQKNVKGYSLCMTPSDMIKEFEKKCDNNPDKLD